MSSRQQGVDREGKELADEMWGSMLQNAAGRRAVKKRRRRLDRAREREAEAQEPEAEEPASGQDT